MGLLSRLGIGGATVDTVFPSTRVTAGESVPVGVEVRGGRSRQHAESLVVGLFTRAGAAGGDRVVPVARTVLAEDLEISPDTDERFEAEVAVPAWTPVTRHGTEVWVDTDLAIDWSVDPHAVDSLHVAPGPRLSRALAALEGLGFVPHRAVPLVADDLRMAAPGTERTRPIVQQFDCHPQSGSYVGSIRRLTVVAAPTASDLRLHLRADMDVDVVYETTRAYELFGTVEVTDETESELRRRFERAIGGDR